MKYQRRMKVRSVHGDPILRSYSGQEVYHVVQVTASCGWEGQESITYEVPVHEQPKVGDEVRVTIVVQPEDET